MSLAFDRFVNNIELRLSKVAIVPVVGTAAGALKILVGVIQIVVFFILGIIGCLFFLLTGNPSLKDYAWTHIQHGCGNIFAGLLEAIPLVGWLISLFRETMHSPLDNMPYSKLGKFMSYESLEQDDIANGRVRPRGFY